MSQLRLSVFPCRTSYIVTASLLTERSPLIFLLSMLHILRTTSSPIFNSCNIFSMADKYIEDGSKPKGEVYTRDIDTLSRPWKPQLLETMLRTEGDGMDHTNYNSVSRSVNSSQPLSVSWILTFIGFRGSS